jgi:hypothetical protein
MAHDGLCDLWSDTHGVVEIHVRPIQLLHLTEAHPRERSNGVPRFTSTEAANGKKTPELIVSQGAFAPARLTR